jgi:hypothetical protein
MLFMLVVVVLMVAWTDFDRYMDHRELMAGARKDEESK